MRTSLYYGEMVSKITAHLQSNPDHHERIARTIETKAECGDSLWTVCAEAGTVFDTLEDLSDEHCVDWHKALDHYADALLDCLLNSYLPRKVDLISMAALGIMDAS